jgi:hypothetical protein
MAAWLNMIIIVNNKNFHSQHLVSVSAEHSQISIFKQTLKLIVWNIDFTGIDVEPHYGW